MKKNILLVHSFIVLPLFTSSFIFSSEISKRDKDFPVLTRSGSHSRKNRKERRREQLDPHVTKIVIKETETPSGTQLDEVIVTTSDVSNEQVVEQAIETAPATEQVEMVTPAIQVAGDEQGTVIELPMPEKKREKAEIPAPVETTTAKNPSIIPTEDVIKERMTKVFAAIQEISANTTPEKIEQAQPIDLLSASIYEPIPVIKQGLGWGEWAKSKLSTTWFAIDAIKSKTFDPENADHMGSLNSAAEKLVLNGDSAGLQDLLQACRTNYSHIKLDKSVALQIQKRFQLDEQGTKKEYADQIERESLNLRKTQERIFAQNVLLIQNVAAQLESSNMELAKAQVAYMTATNDIIAKQNKKLEATHQGTQHLGKLYRKLDTKKQFDSEYLNNLKKVNTLQENIYSNMETLDKINETLTGTLSLLTPKKSDILQLTDK